MPRLNKRDRLCEKQFDCDTQRKKFARLNDTSVAREAHLKRQMEYLAQYYA